MRRVVLTVFGLLLAAAVAALAWASFLCPDCEAVALRARRRVPGFRHEPCCPRCGDRGRIGLLRKLRGSPVTPEIAEILRDSYPAIDYNDSQRSRLERWMGIDAPLAFGDLPDSGVIWATNVRVFESAAGWRLAVLLHPLGRARDGPSYARAILLEQDGRVLDHMTAVGGVEEKAIFLRFTRPGIELVDGAGVLQHGGSSTPLARGTIFEVGESAFARRP